MDHAIYLNNLAILLVDEVRAGRAERARLAEARTFLEQAWRIREQPGVAADDIRQQAGPLIEAIVAATRGDAQAWTKVAAALPALEQQGWHISEGVQRIWQGEREWQVLAEGLDTASALLLLRVLETLAEGADTATHTHWPRIVWVGGSVPE